MLQYLDFASTNSSFVLALCAGVVTILCTSLFISTDSSRRGGYAGINFHNHMELTQWTSTPCSPTQPCFTESTLFCGMVIISSVTVLQMEILNTENWFASGHTEEH